MPCFESAEAREQRAQQEAFDRLRRGLMDGTVGVVNRFGRLEFTGWNDKRGLCDDCAFRKLQGTPELSRALAAGETEVGGMTQGGW